MKPKPIPKEDIIQRYIQENNKAPSWIDKKTTEYTKEEMNEYMKYRLRISNEQKQDIPKPQNSKEQITAEDLINEITEEEQKEEPKEPEEILNPNDKLIQDYFNYHRIDTQEKLNYAIEHDEKFRMFLEKINLLESYYKGKHLEFIKEEKEKVQQEIEEESKKDKHGKIKRKWGRKKIESNVFKDSKKDLDLKPYKNKKLESKGMILCIYLRKNGLAELRYVQMDEVGQIKIDGYVYHERDATYRFGKKNDPVLVILEGSLVPISKEILKENLGSESAEAQKLIIKGIEQAEVVKSGDLNEQNKKKFAPPKWAIGIAIAVIIGIYAFMGGFS